MSEQYQSPWNIAAALTSSTAGKSRSARRRDDFIKSRLEFFDSAIQILRFAMSLDPAILVSDLRRHLWNRMSIAVVEPAAISVHGKAPVFSNELSDPPGRFEASFTLSEPVLSLRG
jgi:hypothetical protein